MKARLSTPMIIGALVVTVAVLGFFGIRTATAEPHTPRPDRSMFLKPTTPPPR